MMDIMQLPGEPNLTSDLQVADVLKELSAREPIFHRAEPGKLRSNGEDMTTADFREIGASGRRYSREFVLQVLEDRDRAPHQDTWETSDFHCERLAEGVYLVTYTLLQNNERLTRRSTIWRSTPEGWKIVFHQGTIVQDSQDRSGQ